jgi:hypothetical protein
MNGCVEAFLHVCSKDKIVDVIHVKHEIRKFKEFVPQTLCPIYDIFS